jgi:hypothetical protein
MTFAHIAGLPLEETVPTLAPTACALALLVRTRLRRLGRWRRAGGTDLRRRSTSSCDHA